MFYLLCQDEFTRGEKITLIFEYGNVIFLFHNYLFRN